jgi:hypothetical protein
VHDTGRVLGLTALPSGCIAGVRSILIKNVWAVKIELLFIVLGG